MLKRFQTPNTSVENEFETFLDTGQKYTKKQKPFSNKYDIEIQK